MFRTLLESQAALARRTGGALVSVGVHTAVVALAIVATARASAPPRIEPDIWDIVYLPPPPPPRVEQHVPDCCWFPLVRPDVSVDPLPVPTIDVPGLSSIDLTKIRGSDDFAERGTAISRAGGGESANPSAPIGGIYTAPMVEEAAAARPGNPAPVYPSSLRSAQLEGSVVARFVVDTAGRAEPASIQFPEASHPAFAEAVRQSLLHSRYLPAMVAGHPVRQLVEQRFSFTLARW